VGDGGGGGGGVDYDDDDDDDDHHHHNYLQHPTKSERFTLVLSFMMAVEYHTLQNWKTIQNILLQTSGM
jgi:hypothetical protein